MRILRTAYFAIFGSSTLFSDTRNLKVIHKKISKITRSLLIRVQYLDPNVLLNEITLR